MVSIANFRWYKSISLSLALSAISIVIVFLGFLPGLLTNQSNLQLLRVPSDLWTNSIENRFTPCNKSELKTTQHSIFDQTHLSVALMGALRFDCVYGLQRWPQDRLGDDPVDLFWAGVIFARNDQTPKAIEVWQRAGAAEYFMASATASRGSLARMTYWADWVFKIAPDNWRYHYLYGILLLSHGDALAEAAFLHSFELNPVQFESTLEIGLINYRRGDDQEALKWCQQAANLGPNDATAWNCVAYAAFHLGDWTIARQALSSSIRLQPSLTFNLLMQARVLRNLNRSDEAIPFLLRAVEIAQEREWDLAGRAWYELGRFYAEKGLVSQALNAFNRSLEIDPASGFDNYAVDIHAQIAALNN